MRAKIVADLEKLNRYQWCGHSVLMGTNTLAGQGTDDVLAGFGKNTGVARNEYLKFIADGIPLGRRDELVGGILNIRRSAVSHAVRRGNLLLAETPSLKDEIFGKTAG